MTDISIPGGGIVSGHAPLVIIGPNGVGKTRLGVALTRQNDGERVAALRNVEIPDIPMARFQQASAEVRSVIQQMMDQHWRQSYELQQLLAEILAEDREAAVQFRELCETHPTTKPDEALTSTRLRKVVNIWNQHFPGRFIKIDYEPKVERTLPNGSKVAYSIAQMSEGERTALYLAARVVSCRKAVLLVDEPETFFHPLLARSFWSALEEANSQLRFVYVTHDIPFALSRKGARFAIARSESTAELLPPTSGIPSDVVTEVLGAASFSISASRLIFCEGLSNSTDVPILSAWHNCPRTAVVPVGSCDAVRECVSVFRAGQVTAGVEAFGYIDRDGWPDAYLNSDQYVKALSVSEIEGLLCIENVFKALAEFHGVSAPDASQKFTAFVNATKAHFGGIVLNKEILNRAKKRVEVEQRALLNPIKPDAQIANMRTAFVSAMPTGGWPTYLTTVFQEEEARLTAVLGAGAGQLLQDLPAKSFYTNAAQQLGMQPDAVARIACQALRLSDSEAVTNDRLKQLRDTIVSSWGPGLWPRAL
jgi:ABC-type cobalamin/Fe3+-siderophores transport system ATPase subunit